MIRISLFLAFLLILSCGKEGQKTSTSSEQATDGAESTAQTGHPNHVYWGDTHLHTDLSMDAGAFGNRIGMDEAYKFAKGEVVMASSGQKAQLRKPLDFLVIADHSDGMGFFPDMMDGKEHVMQYKEVVAWKKMIDEGKGGEAAIDIIQNFSQGTFPFETNDPEMMKPVWKEVVAAAERHNDPGNFTAFIGYEWTSLIKGNNLHRVVIYRDGGDKASQQLPYTNEDSSDPERLWENLSQYEKTTGGQVLAIPHNGNLSNGMMFSETRVDGSSFDESYLKERIRWEPLYEVTQIKGDGEAHPFLSPNDEFADYENWDFGNLDLSALKSDDMLEYEYARSALKIGLKYERSNGVNPYKFGMIGSTDAHTTLATADDDNFFGKASNVEPSKERWKHPFLISANKKDTIFTWETLASGYAAVWAHENTRASIWDGMKRKETYATTGSRILVRFFGSYDFKAQDMNKDYVSTGYEKGVPMGGDLRGAKEGQAPSFLYHALMDPDGASLDRLQIVKGWLNEAGEVQEKVYDVAWSGDRKADANGKVPDVGNTVNTETGSWDNSIGATELKGAWTDPDFDPREEAFYYVRVIEIPTPRWTLYDHLQKGAELPENIPLYNTERAYTSPIWYTP